MNMNKALEDVAGAAEAGFTLHAWVDESMHAQVAGVSESMYLLAAVVAEPTACDTTREQLTALVPRGRQRLHWRDEGARLKRAIAATIAGIDACNLVVVGVGADPARQERARRKCMEALLFRLEELGVSQVWLEARTPSLNKRDSQMVDALRGTGAITKSIRVDLAYPNDEPMLWIPDAVAGATGMARKGAESAHREAMRMVIEEIKLTIKS